ncbi:MAG: glutathione S-transferase N-terminal domain-containing protein [Sandaracinaceae bacterium]|nr:glutathione S-transferase N-terminal domain-containing protein [Sandaracinaceae bacterium]
MRLSSRATIVGIPYSPWSLQARWALHLHRVPYRFEAYTPMIGEPVLRARLSRIEGRLVREKLSVPILIDGPRVVHDSRAIAELVDEEAVARGERTLFPRESLEALDRWLDRLELAKKAGRLLATERMADDDEAILASMPPSWPGVVKRASLPVGRRACRFILDKYGGASFEGPSGRPGAYDREGLRSLLRDVLVAAQDTIARYDHLVGEELTFADLSLVTTLQFVAPSHELLTTSAAFDRSWSDPALAKELAPLLAARDRILAAHPYKPAR